MPGGGVEPGETPAEAALRELAEETGRAARLCGAIRLLETRFEGPRGMVEEVSAVHRAVLLAPSAAPQIGAADGGWAGCEAGFRVGWIPLAALGETDLRPAPLGPCLPRPGAWPVHAVHGA